MQSETASPGLYTIGHSDHEASDFVSLLTRHGVTAVADVRSHPYSRFHGQFNREILSERLKRAGIDYVFLGRELGARRAERESYRDGQARYDLIAGLPAFQQGLDRIRCGLSNRRIALLCAEKDPITCHRAILVCRHLRNDAIDIRHILGDGSIETTEDAEARLLDSVGLPSEHLFRTRADLIEEAYDLQSDRIAFREVEGIHTENGAKI